jgi:hypothetical protein
LLQSESEIVEFGSEIVDTATEIVESESEIVEIDPISSKLETLCIVWCLQLTDTALSYVQHLPKLRTIEATGCTSISQDSVHKLHRNGINVLL